MRKRSLLVFLVGLMVFAFPFFSLAAVEGPTNIEIVLDSSASMAEQVDGVVKINAARKAVKDVLDTMPENYNVSFRLYSHRYSQQEKQKSCTDTEVILPFQQYNEEMKASIENKLLQVTPRGLTPIAYTLKQAAEDFEGKKGENIIILVSDGEETCGGDPFKIANSINALDIGVKVYVIGFDVKSSAQLRGIAKRAGGSYYDAKNAQELSTVFKQAVKEATEEKEVSIPYHEDFEDGRISSEWRLEEKFDSEWVVEEGALTTNSQISDRTLKAFVGESDWKNYVFNLDVTYDPDDYDSRADLIRPWERDHDVGIFFAAESSQNMMGFFLNPGRKSGIRVKQYGIWGEFVGEPKEAPEAHEYSITIVVSEEKVAIALDGELFTTVESPTYTEGYVGFQSSMAWGNEYENAALYTRFDNIKVEKMK